MESKLEQVFFGRLATRRDEQKDCGNVLVTVNAPYLSGLQGCHTVGVLGSAAVVVSI